MELLTSIKDLLLLNDCVIIPGFGGFVSSYQPAGLQGARFTPPAKTVSFNRKLNFNDGLFINYVADRKGISYFLASRKVNLLVEEMNYRLTDGEEICIPGTGTLRYDDRENLIFIPQITENLNPDAFGLTAFTYESLNSRKRQLQPVPQSRRDATQVIFQKRAMHKVLIAAPLLLALAITPLKHNQDYFQQSDLSNLSAMITFPKPEKTALEETVAEESQEASPEEVVAGHPYFLIGGSFKEEKNARAFLSAMKKSGYPARNLGIIRGLHYIALESYASFDEARKAHQDYLSKLPDSGAWIYVKR
ncbi:MAG: hypothetical protein AB7D05_00505 [Mangrovibacterium sp.]